MCKLVHWMLMSTSTANICLSNCPLVDCLEHYNRTKPKHFKDWAHFAGVSVFAMHVVHFAPNIYGERNQLIKCYSNVKHCSHFFCIVQYFMLQMIQYCHYLLVKKFQLKMEIESMEKRAWKAWKKQLDTTFVWWNRIGSYYCTPFNQTYCSTQIKQHGGSFTFSL